jgi:AAA ATPase domain
MQKALAGNRQVVFVTGEAGIGKTTLVDMAMQRLGRLGFGVLRCCCNELFGTHEAFMPLIESLQELCRGADGSELLKALRDQAPTWLAQMPGFFGPLAPGSHGHGRLRNGGRTASRRSQRPARSQPVLPLCGPAAVP